MKAKAEKSTHAKPKKDHSSKQKQEGDLFIPPKIQPKLRVNNPGDPFEQEAEAVADKIMQGPVEPLLQEDRKFRLQPEQQEEEQLQLKTEGNEGEAAMHEVEEEEQIQRSIEPEEEMVQRKCESCGEEIQRKLESEEEEEEIQRKLEPEEGEEEIQRKLEHEDEEEEIQRKPTLEEDEEEIQLKLDPEEEQIQRKCASCEEEESIQLKSKNNNREGQTAPPLISEVISSDGSPLDNGTRRFMEERFGADFSNVRIYNDVKAHYSANLISAQAYTYGAKIVFAEGKYEPQTETGRHLLAHELTHVIQQGQSIRRQEETSEQAPPSETTPEAPPILEENSSNEAASPAPVPLEEAPASETEQGAVPTLPEEVVIEPIMPAPPEELGEAAQQRLRNSQSRTRTSASANAELPSSDDLTQVAREGVTEPEIETTARAGGAVAATLGERIAPSPEILELCENIRRVIRDKRPPDEDSLLQADPEEAANEAGSQLNDNIDSDVDRVEGQYDELDQSPAGTPEQVAEEIVVPPEQVAEPDINAQGAAPDPLTEEEVSLDADLEASGAQIEDAGMATPVAEVITDGPVEDARAAHGDLEQSAAEDPALVLAEQDVALANSRQEMEALQQQALLALESSRTSAVQSGSGQQLAMVGSEEQQRAEMSARAEEFFTTAQGLVNTQLEPLTTTAMGMWETGKERIATEFEQHLAEVQSWVDDRHSGIGGGVLSVWDDLTGLPGWVTDEYDDAERNFGDSICDLIQEISLYVNGIIVICEEIIDNANQEIDNLFANAPEELAEWAAAEREGFQTRLDGLREQVTNTQDNFNRDLANQAAQAVQEVREQVHALREAAKGLLDKIADAIQEFLDDPIRAIINGLLRLVSIDPAAFWALAARIEQVVSDIADDPLGFASNLLAAIGAGFQLFFDNFFSHLFEGFIQWIFSGLGAVGVEIPADFSLGSIITFFLQLMGITWERIRMLLARHIGEENVALLEQAYEIISDLIELGPAGVFELIKDQLDPQHILDTIINMAVDFVIETLVTQATIRIIALFNPVGAIAQAIEAIYKVLKWIFENAARIFTLVESVVNGIADILAGNIAGMAATVENALAQLLVPVIDFIAEFMSLGGLPERVADAVRGLQEWVEGILDRVIGWLAGQARAILSALGISEDADPEEENAEEEELEDTEVGKVVTFTAAGESHRLWIDTNGTTPKVMMASTPQEVNTVLNELETHAENGVDEDAPELIDQAQATTTELTQQAATTEDLIEQTQDEQQEEGEVAEAEQADEATEALETQLAQQVSDAIEAAEEPEVPAATFSPFSNSKAEHFEARNVYKHPDTGPNHPAGSEPSQSHLREAFSIITDLGVNAAWVRFHILNAYLGGKAKNSNLIPTPGFVNNPEYLNQFEVPLKNLYNDNKPIWFLATVNYYSSDPEFVQNYDAVGGALKYENGAWVEDSANDVPSYSVAPGLPDIGALEINDIINGEESLKRLVSRLTSLSARTLQVLKDGQPSGGYSTKTQMKDVIGQSDYSDSRKNTVKRYIDNIAMSDVSD